MGGIDLHTHTNRSDGTFAPPELVKLASQRGLEVVAITDHDTTDGLEEAARAGRELGVEVVPGVELSAEHQGTSVHVLCYWMDPENEGLQAELVRLRSERFLRGQALVEAGVVADEEEAFDRLIGDEGPASVPKHALAPLDALALVRRAGGACVLAHPGMWSAEAPIPEDLIEAMAEAGMAGLE